MHFEIKINMLLKADFSLLDLKFKYKCITLWMNIQYVHERVCKGLIQVHLILNVKSMSANHITAQV